MRLTWKGINTDMALDVVTMDFDLDDLIYEIEEAAEEAIEEGVEFAKQEFVKRIPSNRKLTRRSVIAISHKMSGIAGVRFPPGKRYPKDGTKTKAIVTRAWHSMKGQTLNVIRESIDNGIEEINR